MKLSRLFLITLLLGLQMYAPFLHAHVGESSSPAGLHVHAVKIQAGFSGLDSQPEWQSMVASSLTVELQEPPRPPKLQEPESDPDAAISSNAGHQPDQRREIITLLPKQPGAPSFALLSDAPPRAPPFS